MRIFKKLIVSAALGFFSIGLIAIFFLALFVLGFFFSVITGDFNSFKSLDWAGMLEHLSLLLCAGWAVFTACFYGDMDDE